MLVNLTYCAAVLSIGAAYLTKLAKIVLAVLSFVISVIRILAEP